MQQRLNLRFKNSWSCDFLWTTTHQSNNKKVIRILNDFIFIYSQTLRQMLTRIFIYLLYDTCITILHARNFYWPLSLSICWSTRKPKSKEIRIIITKKHATWARLCVCVCDKNNPQNPMSWREGWKENPDFMGETRQIKCRHFVLCVLYLSVRVCVYIVCSWFQLFKKYSLYWISVLESRVYACEHNTLYTNIKRTHRIEHIWFNLNLIKRIVSTHFNINELGRQTERQTADAHT